MYLSVVLFIQMKEVAHGPGFRSQPFRKKIDRLGFRMYDPLVLGNNDPLLFDRFF